MDYISEKISRDPVTGKLYVGKKPGDDQAPDAPAAPSQQSKPPKDLDAIRRDRDIVYLRGDPNFAGSTGRISGPTGRIYRDDPQRNYNDPNKVFTTTTKTPGANSTTTTQNGGNTSTVQTRGGGTTEIKLNDTRTPAEKASDEAKDKADAEARLADAEARLAARKAPAAATAAATVASGTPQPEKKGSNFSFGGVDPTTKKGFLGVQPGRDPADTFSGKLANLFIPRMDKETGRLYMGTQVGRDPKRTADTAAAGTPAAGTPAAGTPSQNASDKTAAPKLSSFGAAFKAAREARLSGKGGDTFEFGGKKYHSYQAGEKRPGAGAASAAKPAAVPAASKASAESPQEPPLSDKESAAIQREKDIGKTGTANLISFLPPAKVGDRMLDDIIAGGVRRSMGRKYDERGVIQNNPISLRKPTKESIEHYKEAFRAVLAEASDQKFTDYDIERQVSHGLGQQYDKNNPEHKKKADALRKYHQSKGRYLLYPESINQSASRTDQAAREQAARNSQSAQAQARYSGYGYSAKRTAGGGGSRGGGGSGGGSASRGTGSPTGASAPGATDGKVLSYLKTGGRFAGALPVGLFGGWAGGKLGVATSAFLTPKDYNSKTDYPKSLPQPGPDGKDSTGKEVDTNYNAKIAAARGEYGRSATIKGSETAGQWAVGGYAIDKTMQALGSPKPATAWMPNIKKPSTILGPTVKANLARGLGTGVGVGLGQYIRNKTANTPYKDAGGLAGDVLTGAGYGYGVAGKPGAVVGGTVGLLKSATRIAGDDYKSASDESRARQRSRGIARFGFNPYERLDAEVEAEKKKQAALKPKIDLPPGYGVLKREYQKKPQ